MTHIQCEFPHATKHVAYRYSTTLRLMCLIMKHVQNNGIQRGVIYKVVIR